jgi:hypothetical protein
MTLPPKNAKKQRFRTRNRQTDRGDLNRKNRNGKEIGSLD